MSHDAVDCNGKSKKEDLICLENNVYGLSNGGLQAVDEEWAKVTKGKAALAKILDEDDHDSAD